MTERLVLWQATGWSWSKLDEEWRGAWSPLDHSDDLATLAAESGAVTVLLDSKNVLLSAVEIPVADDNVAERAIPYAIEDDLIDAVENLEFVVRRTAGRTYAVAVFAKSVLQDVFEELPDVAGLTVDVIPDVLAIPFREGRWSAVVLGRETLIRTDRHKGCRVLTSETGAVAAALRAGTDSDQPVDIYAVNSAEGDLLAETLGPGFDVSVESGPDRLRAMLGEIVGGSTLSLRRAPASNGAGTRGRRMYVAAAALALLALVLHPALSMARLAKLEASIETTEQRIEALFREAFPDVPRLVNPRVQARQEMDKLRKTAGSKSRLLDLLAAYADTAAAGPDTAVELSSLLFTDTGLDITVRAESIKTVDQLRGALEGSGLIAELSSAQADGADTLARLRIGVREP